MTRAWEQKVNENCEAVLERWLSSIVAMLPGEKSRESLLASAIAAELDGLLDAVMDRAVPAAEPIMRITRILAVQEIAPSKALSILFLLRGLIEELAAECGHPCRDRLEELTLQAFDSFMKHRETIYQLKFDEGRRKMHMALRRVEA